MYDKNTIIRMYLYFIWGTKMEKQTVGPLEISEANSMFYYGEILSTC